jgi:hypothetical protein
MNDRERLLTEYDDRDQSEIEIETWRQLEWIRVEKQRKQWWAKFFFKSLFRKLPEEWMLTLTPMEPSAKLAKLVRRRDNQFKRNMRKKEAAQRGKRCLI